MESNLAYKAFETERWSEMIGGKIVMMSPASLNHNRVVTNITRIFGNHLTDRTCEVFTDGAPVYLTDEDYYIPDVMIVCDPSKAKPDGVHGAPDLVVEVLSPGTLKYDRGRKKDIYEKCGVREYWIVDPANKTVEQYLLQDGKFVLHNSYAILPDWMLKRMVPEDQAAASTEFKCSLYDDLVIRLEDVFAKVP